MTLGEFYRTKRLDAVYLVLAHGCYGGQWDTRWVPMEWQQAYRQWCIPHNSAAVSCQGFLEVGERVSLPRLRLKVAA